MIPKTVSTAELASLLDTTPKTVAEYAKSGVVTRASRGRYAFAASLRGFAKHMRTRPKGGEAAAGAVAAQRARLLKLQADRVERENLQAEGKLLWASEVEATWRAQLRFMRDELRRVTTIVSGRVPHLDRATTDAIASEIDRVLVNFAEGHGADGEPRDPGTLPDYPRDERGRPVEREAAQ
jgi:phage terminase Nu1 subunit (DNA packaging protein)